MQQFPFTNIHTHVFNSACAPDRFLRVIPSSFVRKHSEKIKNSLDSKISYKLLNGFGKILSKKNSVKRGMFEKMISFLDIGTEREQGDILEIAMQSLNQHHSKTDNCPPRLVALSLDMDYMDSVPSTHMKSFQTQLEELRNLKRYYPDQLFLFLGIDPRNKKGNQLLQWARKYFETGIEKDGIVYPYFCGIKLYPALGFFPFDPALDELYAYCEKNRIPVMTHCTRVGSLYIGDSIEEYIPDEPEMISNENSIPTEIAKKEIIERIKRYKNAGWIKNNTKGENDLACDLFCHPQNYIPLLEKYPRLKICLAHLGGSNEILNAEIEKTAGTDLSQIRKTDGYNWFESIKTYMINYPQLYSDISYTLSSFDEKKVLQKVVELLETNDKNGNSLGNRILFGTDFFMTEQEKKESELFEIARRQLHAYFDKMSTENNQRFLCQPLAVHPSI